MMIKTNNMNKEEQKKLLIEVMEADEKDGLYKQQTAVEWLFDQIPLEWTIKGSAKKIFEQAKQMEKEQIFHAFGVGCHVESTRLIGYHGMAEQYYNETYGK
jgi:hypothetical protein